MNPIRILRYLKRKFDIAFGQYHEKREDNYNNNVVCLQSKEIFQLTDVELRNLNLMCALPEDNEYYENKRIRLGSTSQIVAIGEESIQPLLALRQLLTCSVCLETCMKANQCLNGHLICLSCSVRLEQSSYINSGSCLCPICRVSLNAAKGSNEISSKMNNSDNTTGIQRCLLAEKLAAELPIKCMFCNEYYQKQSINIHQNVLCDSRFIRCKYHWIGCTWKGKASEVDLHLSTCSVFDKPVHDLMHALSTRLQSFATKITYQSRPWNELIRLLEDRQHVRFGLRGLTGLRITYVSVLLNYEDKFKGESSNNKGNNFQSSLICLPLGPKNSIWLKVCVQISSLYNNGEASSNSPQFSVYDDKVSRTYNLQLSISSKKSNQSSTIHENQYFPTNQLFYILTSFGVESDNLYEVIDKWHCYAPTDTKKKSVDGENDLTKQSIINENDVGSNSFYLLRNDIFLPEKVKEIDNVNQYFQDSDIVSKNDTIFCNFLMAIDPKLYLLSANKSEESMIEEISLDSSGEDDDNDDDNLPRAEMLVTIEDPALLLNSAAYTYNSDE